VLGGSNSFGRGDGTSIELSSMKYRARQQFTEDAESIKLGSVTITICRDPDDNRILETAIIGDCECIVSGDKDLLSLEHYHKIRILKPAEFLEQVA
jgi:predicted nucleic acid-binding protein